jgi:hypothetical protein
MPQLRHRLRKPTSSASYDVPQPYVDFILYIYNASVWPVTFERAEGRVTVNGSDIQGNLEIEQGGGSRIARASKAKFRFRQWLARDVVASIKPEQLTFGLQRVTLLFRVNPDGLHGHPVGGYCGVRLSDPIGRLQ